MSTRYIAIIPGTAMMTRQRKSLQNYNNNNNTSTQKNLEFSTRVGTIVH